jgi:hypothetical protein
MGNGVELSVPELEKGECPAQKRERRRTQPGASGPSQFGGSDEGE